MIRKQEITTFEFPEGAVIWDVRDPKSYQQGHIQGAINYPIDTLDDQKLQQVQTGEPIYILCGGGSKAPRAAELLNTFDDRREYVILMGGTRAARDAGLPMISE
ncbi:sulfurtransferase [Acinetobacter qingfengensis]|uniref:Sulfurtransferase n=1 Tax=Acinetobacter qingfengensis TaxID=1262585 RepID=A0A1E7RFN3_9GAMM|nr:rhodanese-like domain-containing protein [Acinetobacter qingfengensis]KAA8731829.1 sulfurtransferase [Acinetobacter qingfengensis]OEY98047.1 sulfurtransferase [Acinetobacter qingfengensis]